MPTAQRAKIQVELNQTMVAYTQADNSGDNKTFTVSGGPVWSGRIAPVIRPNGISSGRKILTPHTNNNTVNIAAFNAYSKGVEYEKSATTLVLTRPSTNPYKVCSVTMDESGAIAEVEGTEGASSSETRGANGGPPHIPVDSVELGQVRFTSTEDAAIADDAIYQEDNSHAERATNPSVEYDPIGKGMRADNSYEKNAYCKFSAALMQNHTGDVCKRVYIQYYTPQFTTIQKTTDFSPAEVGVTKSSEKMYSGSGVSGAIGSMSADSIGDLSFVVFGESGIDEGIVEERNQTVLVKFFPDANKPEYLLTQGLLGIEREYPPDGQIKINCTVYCEKESVEFVN